MHDEVYKIVELVGSSSTSIEDAVETAVSRASSTIRHLRWCEILETRAKVVEGKVSRYQVVLKAGFALDGGEGVNEDLSDEQAGWPGVIRPGEGRPQP